MENEDKVPTLRYTLSQAYDAQTTEEPAPEETVTPDDGQEAAPDEQTEVAAESATEEQEPETVIEAPATWSKEDRDAFDALDEAGRKTLLGIHKNMESGLNRKMEELAEQRKRYQGLDSFTENLQSQFPTATKDQINSALSQAIPAWFETYRALQSDPVGTLRKIADAYNVGDKLSEALLSQDNDESARKARLREQELEAENIRLRNEQLNAQRQKAESVIAEFRDATGPDGKLLRPYFKELEPVMAKTIAADPSITLEKAYQMAMRTEKFEELQQQERERVKAELEAERRKKANARKVTKPTIGRSNGASTPAAKPKSLRETLADNWDELSTRQ